MVSYEIKEAFFTKLSWFNFRILKKYYVLHTFVTNLIFWHFLVSVNLKHKKKIEMYEKL